eukprot:3078331-Pyramimonas_sp.AAC.1
MAACDRERTEVLSGRARARRVRAGTHASKFGAGQTAPRASGHARKRFLGAPECAACERARTGALSRRARVHR